jgi:D-alanine-D-alanine ligase
VVAVGITVDGSWVLTDGRAETLAIADRKLPEVVGESGTELALAADPMRRGQLLALGNGPGGNSPGEVLASVDVVFPILHGPYGEDGTIQGMLELAGVPYVGAGVLASAAGMDKEFTKKLLAAAGLPIGDHLVLRSNQSSPVPEEIERLGLPLFVKPARGGSSIGVSRVSRIEDLPEAIAVARRYDPKVIVEKAIIGRELECGVLEFPDGSVKASVIGEIKVTPAEGSCNGFYDFATKYLDDAAELNVPANISAEDSDVLRDLAIRTFNALDCQGLARVDFFLTEEGPVVNEINTMPGFTTISMYPRMWAASGVDYPTLVTTMVETALARGTGLR